jgi:hypothetical protein
MSARERVQEFIRSPARRPSIHRAADLDASSLSVSTETAPGQPANAAPAAPSTILGLQRSHGNRFVQRMLQRQASASENDCPGGCT